MQDEHKDLFHKESQKGAAEQHLDETKIWSDLLPMERSIEHSPDIYTSLERMDDEYVRKPITHLAFLQTQEKVHDFYRQRLFSALGRRSQRYIGDE